VRKDSLEQSRRGGGIDVQVLFTIINPLHHARDKVLLFACNSGRRSLYAARLLRSMGYGNALSVAGGFQALKAAAGPGQGLVRRDATGAWPRETTSTPSHYEIYIRTCLYQELKTVAPTSREDPE
jgi:rhodanese-related sulfurtransferase